MLDFGIPQKLVLMIKVKVMNAAALVEVWQGREQREVLTRHKINLG